MDEDYDEPGTRCIRETAKAILVVSESFDETWVPRSVLGDDSEVEHECDEGTLFVKSWWAQKEGWL